MKKIKVLFVLFSCIIAGSLFWGCNQNLEDSEVVEYQVTDGQINEGFNLEDVITVSKFEGGRNIGIVGK